VEKIEPRGRIGESPCKPLTESIYTNAHLRFNYRMEDISPQEREFLDSVGWYSHVVVADGQRWVNYHTHGLPEHYGHLDFQFVLPLESETLHALASKLVDRVKKGERFVAGTRVSGITKQFEVLLIQMAESRSTPRLVLRVILPDKDGNLERGMLKGLFAAQFQDLPA
jgi:hypothetical protein